tara:strand:+ start:1760 stop:2050 length:291 start_codon:yes stop_codon:yes gene_type:complete
MKDFIQVCFQISFLCLTIALALSSYRAFIGPRLPNRVLGLNLMSTVFACFAILLAVFRRHSIYIDLSVTVAVIEFLATVAFARYIKYQNLGGPNVS